MTIAAPTATGWRVHAKADCLDVWLTRDGGPPIRIRVVKGRLTKLDVQALKALQQPVLVAHVPRRSRVTAPRTYRGRDNQGTNRKAFILQLGGRSPVEMTLVGQSMVGTGLLKALQHRINHRRSDPVPLPPAFLQKEPRNGEQQRPEGQLRAEEVLPDPEVAREGQLEGFDQPGQLLAAQQLDQEPLGA